MGIKTNCFNQLREYIKVTVNIDNKQSPLLKMLILLEASAVVGIKPLDSMIYVSTVKLQ